MGMDATLEADNERGRADRLAAENNRLLGEHQNLKLLFAAVLTELGGMYEVPNATLVATEGEVQAEELPERGTVRVHGR